MAEKRTRELRLLPGEDVPRRAGERSVTARAAAQARMPGRRAGRNPFSPGPPQPAAKRTLKGWPIDLPGTLYIQVVQQWVQTLTGPFDWANWPLDRYVFSDALLGSLECQTDLENVAWVCAVVACGLAHEFDELGLEQRDGPGCTHLLRNDGAKGYRCSILSGRGAGACLDLWRLPSGVIEFDVFTVIRLVHGTKTHTVPGPTEC
jgi:hypothetical protein